MASDPKRRFHRWATASLLVAALLLECAVCGSCGQPSFSGAGAGKLDAALEAVMTGNNIPGALAGARSKTGKVWSGAGGKADLEANVPMQADMKFRIGSNTKSFTAVVILQLRDEKKLALDDPLSMYLPAYAQWGTVTVRQLLNMTSGIYNYTDDPDFWSGVEADPLKQYSPEQLVAIAEAHPPIAQPGGDWFYSNTNYVLLGMIIEKVTGKSAGAEITARTIDKLGLEHTEFATGPDMTGKYSHGYRENPTSGQLEDITRINPSMAWTAGCMVSNLIDLETWLEALVDGKLVSKDSLKEQMTFVDTGMPFVKYGLGVFEVNRYVGNGGAIPGFNSAMFRHPTRKDQVVCMFNKDPIDCGKALAMTDGVFQLLGAMAGEK